MSLRALALGLTAALLGLSACGGDGDDTGDGDDEGQEPPSGPAIVSGGITLNGDETQGQVGLLPKGKKVTLRKTRPDGSFRLTGVKPGKYELTADVNWQIAPPEPGQDLGPAKNRPCSAKGYSVDNLFLQLGNYFVIATATSEAPVEVEPGDRVALSVDYKCKL